MNEELEKVGGQTADTCLWLMCVGCGMGAASSDLFHFVPGAFLMALFMISLIMPINLKFGVQKARLLLLAVVALPILMISLMTVLGLVFPGIMFYGGFKLDAYAIVFITLAVVAAAAIGSYFLSVRIMNQKEF